MEPTTAYMVRSEKIKTLCPREYFLCGMEATALRIHHALNCPRVAAEIIPIKAYLIDGEMFISANNIVEKNETEDFNRQAKIDLNKEIAIRRELAIKKGIEKGLTADDIYDILRTEVYIGFSEEV